jgi:hypothetical protein
MNRYLAFSLAVSVILSALAIPLRAANKPRAGKMEKATKVWTNEDLERLRAPGLISIVGSIEEEQPAPTTGPVPYEEMSAPEPSPTPYVETQDPEWYAEQATRLRNQLEYRQAQLSEYRQALEDARSLRETTGGINLVGENFAITPEAGIEILQQRVSETQAKLDELEDLACHNDIEPGTLRGQ